MVEKRIIRSRDIIRTQEIFICCSHHFVKIIMIINYEFSRFTFCNYDNSVQHHNHIWSWFITISQFILTTSRLSSVAVSCQLTYRVQNQNQNCRDKVKLTLVRMALSLLSPCNYVDWPCRPTLRFAVRNATPKSKGPIAPVFSFFPFINIPSE